MSFARLLAMVVVVLGCFASPAAAQATRTWVSGVGSDADPCSRAAPCKTFAAAISKTAAGGEINCLDAGGFGGVTITKSITIDCTGSFGGVLAGEANDAVVVNAGANDRVRLRGLRLNGNGTALTGVHVLAVGSVLIEGSTIAAFVNNGVDVSMAASGEVLIRDASILDNAVGVRVSSTAGTARVTLDRVLLMRGATAGLLLNNGANSVVRDSVVAHCGIGVHALGGVAFIDNVMITNNNFGIQGAVGTTVRVGRSTVTGNVNGLNVNGGSIISFGTNHIAGNNTNGAPTSVVGQE